MYGQVSVKFSLMHFFPMQARLARHQRDRVIKCNGGIAPEAGHKDYKVFSKFCRFAEKHYPPHSCTPSPL